MYLWANAKQIVMNIKTNSSKAIKKMFPSFATWELRINTIYKNNSLLLKMKF